MTNNKLKLLIFSILLFFVGSYFFVNYVIGKEDKFSNLRSSLNNEHKQLIKKYIFPYKLISQQKQQISILNQAKYEQDLEKLNKELNFKKSKQDTRILRDFKLSNNKVLKYHVLDGGFELGIFNKDPGSGFIDFYQKNLFILSSRGVLIYSKSLSDENYLKQIENNIDDFIGIKHYSKNADFSIKDLYIYKNKIFISYTEEIKEDCWNTSVIYGNINYESIEFQKLFSPKECVLWKETTKNIGVDNEFTAHQAGGKIVSFDDNHILLSVGEYKSRHLAQNKESVNGKILKININNSDYEIISMGHRSPQGLYLDKENNFILETEHGPRGGDEINLIEIDKMTKNEPFNYGWPVASAGEHYCKKKGDCHKDLYVKYPLYKSHSEHGFIEPLKSFAPKSIAISEITKIKENKYVASSLKDKSLYFFELDSRKKIINFERVEVFERVRDLIFNDNKLYLFLEDTASIGVISLN